MRAKPGSRTLWSKAVPSRIPEFGETIMRAVLYLCSVSAFICGRPNIRFPLDASCDDFRKVQDFDVVAFRVVCGVSTHDRTIRAGDHHRRHFCFRELSESKLVHPPFIMASRVVRDKKLRPACTAALRILAVMRRFCDRIARRAQNFP